MIRHATHADAARIAEIYNHFIEHTIVSFELEPVPAQQMASRIEKITKQYPWLVIEDNAQVVGYAYAGPWHARAAYQYTVEIAIYLAHDHVGQGHGTQLYHALFKALADYPLHLYIAGISLPNEASVAFHEKFGFKKAAHYTEVGRKFDQWIDVGYWQKKVQ